jgi:hypothetical protein
MEFSYTTLGYIFNTLALIIFIYILIHSIVRIQNKEKLKSNDFALQVFTPNTIALFLFAIGSWFIITDTMTKDGIDETFFIQFITATSAGGIFISLFTLILSNLVANWKA